MNDHFYKDLTYKVIGSLYEVFRELGFGLQERYYQRAVSAVLEQQGIIFKREVNCPIRFQDRIIGRYFFDFLIEDKLVLELKVANEFYESHIKQVLSYLKSSKLKLGLLGIVTPAGIKVKRVIN